MKIRISLVHYLNAAPLGWAFLHGPFRDRFEVIPSAPAVCADQLARGEVEIGLIPSIEYQRIPGLKLIPDISIASLAEIRSLLLIKPKGKREINSVALDTSSRTTVALAKVLLQVKMGLHPKYVPMPPDLPKMLRSCDAAVLIGDAALQIRLEDYDTFDLAKEWVEWQGIPFVCALWACRNSFGYPQNLKAMFLEAKEWGLNRRKEIAAAYSKALDLPSSFLEEYLTKNIDFDLGPHHIEGLQRFYHLARQQNLISDLHPLEFI